jgi:hypothetical protein
VAEEESNTTEFQKIIRLSYAVALLRKAKRLKSKGKRLSERAVRQWCNAHGPRGASWQTREAALGAIHRACEFGVADHQLHYVAALLLQRELLGVVFPRGSSHSGRGLFGQVAPHLVRPNGRLSGRPPLLSLSEERAFLAWVTGAKVGLIANRRWPTSDMTFHNVVDRLGREIGRDEFFDRINEWISDGKVALLASTRALVPPGSSIEAIKSRIRRARKTFKLDLPRGIRKVG